MGGGKQKWTNNNHSTWSNQILMDKIKSCLTFPNIPFHMISCVISCRCLTCRKDTSALTRRVGVVFLRRETDVTWRSPQRCEEEQGGCSGERRAVWAHRNARPAAVSALHDKISAASSHILHQMLHYGTRWSIIKELSIHDASDPQAILIW